MNGLEDDIREVLDRQAQAMRVPNPHLDPSLTLTRVTAQPTPGRVWMLVTAAALIGIVVAAVVLVERPSDKSVLNTDIPTVNTLTPPDITTAAGGSPFAAAIESAGTLIKPSAAETATASDTSLYETDRGSTQVSGAANFAALRTCPTPTFLKLGESSDQPCGRAWAYVTGSVDGSGVHRGVLGEADEPEVFVLDDRFFVAMETSPGSQRTPTAWLIDSVSGGHGELTWRDEPTTVNSPEQALVISDGHGSVARWAQMSAAVDGRIPELFLPRVVDARDGTIRPLAVPDNASANLPVTQNGQGRIWIGTTLDGHKLGAEDRDAVQVAGFAYSDDGGATWTEVTMPPRLFESERLATKYSSGVSTAADGDHIAVTSAWSYNDERYVYVSSDAGLNWSTVTVANPSTYNGAHLYVLADKRLLLVRSNDPYAAQILASAGSDWTNLNEPQAIFPGGNPVSANRDGILFKHYDDLSPSGGADRSQFSFSTDLTKWRTIAALGD